MAKTELVTLENFSIPLSALKEKEGRIFPTTISLDIALSGGIPEGVNVLLSGKPKVGKTTLALHYVQKCMQMDPTKKCWFFDVEGRLRSGLAECFPSLNEDNFTIVKSNKDKILTAEDYLNLIYTTLLDNHGCICILDSIAALCPEVQMSVKIGEKVKMLSVPTLMYDMFKKTSQILSVTMGTYIALTHMIANPTPMAKSVSTVGGNANLYGATVWLEAPYKKDIVDGDEVIGQNAMFNVCASALGAPGRGIAVPIIYGRGVDEVRDLFEVAVSFGLIEKAGSWYKFDEDNKFQGATKATQFLRDNPKIAEVLDDTIRGLAIANYESKIDKKPTEGSGVGSEAIEASVEG